MSTAFNPISREPAASGSSAAVVAPRKNRWRETVRLREVDSRGLRKNSPRGFPEATFTHKLVMSLAVGLPFAGAIAAAALLWQWGFMGWLYVGLLVVGWLLTGSGITIGFHRLLTHRSFETHRWVRWTFMALGALSVEGSPLVWCAIHRRHHELSDQPGDPHSPHLHGGGVLNTLRGLWHAQTGWLFTGYWTHPELDHYVPDLLADPALVLVDRLYYLWVVTSLFIPTFLGGLVTGSWKGALLGLLWGGLVRIFITHHITWSINSVCHVFGSREFEAHDESRNNWLCGVLGLGEGWHNTHHAFPTSARHGLAWWQLDVSWLIIRAMQVVGLAWNVRLPSERMIAEKRLVARS
jgi:stearoyl-CoA desaturase (delta-9 desaturase)